MGGAISALKPINMIINGRVRARARARVRVRVRVCLCVCVCVCVRARACVCQVRKPVSRDGLADVWRRVRAGAGRAAREGDGAAEEGGGGRAAAGRGKGERGAGGGGDGAGDDEGEGMGGGGSPPRRQSRGGAGRVGGGGGLGGTGRVQGGQSRSEVWGGAGGRGGDDAAGGGGSRRGDCGACTCGAAAAAECECGGWRRRAGGRRQSATAVGSAGRLCGAIDSDRQSGAGTEDRVKGQNDSDKDSDSTAAGLATAKVLIVEGTAHAAPRGLAARPRRLALAYHDPDSACHDPAQWHAHARRPPLARVAQVMTYFVSYVMTSGVAFYDMFRVVMVQYLRRAATSPLPPPLPCIPRPYVPRC